MLYNKIYRSSCYTIMAITELQIFVGPKEIQRPLRNCSESLTTRKERKFTYSLTI